MKAALSNAAYRHTDENRMAAKVDRSIPFIETHHHLWELERFPYQWLRDPGTAAHNDRLGDYKMIRTDWGIERLLKGAGTRVRHVILSDVAILDEPAVRGLVRQAIATAPRPIDARAPRRMVIRSVSARQRPRRPARERATPSR